jgi:hypothetical protein
MQNGSRFYESTWERNNMNRDDIIRIAKEAGGHIAELPNGDAWVFDEAEQLERFAALVAAAEREVCAEMVGGMDVQHPKYIAAAIRARGEA